ncbi:MAG TPA: hypothetical protein VLB44_11925 [Kofleriaceae bacterium]|nr:hypothetical protein [Kofleriaceae bacterium]
MLHRVAGVVALALMGCNAFFGLEETQLKPSVGGDTDLDLDGIPDGMDPCIAAMLDATDDYDNDDVLNSTDPCPFDPANDPKGNPDMDLDGVNDACDPFPAMAGDTHRCTMRFYNTDLNARLWHETDATPTWSSVPGMLYANEDGLPSTLAATFDLEKVAEPTFDVSLYTTTQETGSNHGARVWVRAADPASRDDVGCEVYGNSTYTRIAIALGDGRDVGTPMMLLGTPFPLGSELRMQVTVIPATGMIRCVVSRYPDRWTVSAPATLGRGTFGFGSEGFQMQVHGLAIYDRSAVVALP